MSQEFHGKEKSNLMSIDSIRSHLLEGIDSIRSHLLEERGWGYGSQNENLSYRIF